MSRPSSGDLRVFGSWAILGWAGWVTVAVLFAVDPASRIMEIVSVVSVLTFAVVVFHAPLSGLCLLPLPLMIGPVLSFPIVDVGRVTVGDVCSTILIIRTMLLRYAPDMSAPTSLRFASWILVLSAVLSIDIGASAIALVKIFQFTLLVCASAKLVRQPVDVRNIMISWVMTTTLCAAMLLWFLYQGLPAFMLYWVSNIDTNDIADFSRADVLFRPTFFYTNFFIPAGLSLLYGIVAILTTVESRGVARAFIYFSVPVNFIALVLNNTRAMLVPVVLLGGATVIWFAWQTFTQLKLHLLAVVFLVLVAILGVGAISDVLVSPEQGVALEVRAEDTGSLEVRLDMWGAVLKKALDDPLRLLFVGWGPQITTRSGHSIVKTLLTGTGGNIEGAFDSVVVGLLIDNGLVFVTLLLGYVAFWLYRTWRLWRNTNDDFVLALLLMGVALIVSHLFQQFGISPPALMAMQVFVFLSVFRRNQHAAVVAAR